MRDDFEITVDQVDLAVSALEHGGTVGARMTGGGFGGSVIGLVPRELALTVEQAVRRAFADAGLLNPTSFLARPSTGARRLD